MLNRTDTSYVSSFTVPLPLETLLLNRDRKLGHRSLLSKSGRCVNLYGSHFVRWVIPKRLRARRVLLEPLLPMSDTSVMKWQRARFSSYLRSIPTNWMGSRISAIHHQMSRISKPRLRGVYELSFAFFFRGFV